MGTQPKPPSKDSHSSRPLNGVGLPGSTDNPWCEQHSDRGKLLEYGKLAHWPYLDCFPYALNKGYEYWANAALVGTDDYIRVALAAIEATWNEEVPA